VSTEKCFCEYVVVLKTISVSNQITTQAIKQPPWEKISFT